MTPEELKKARKSLGYRTQEDFANLVGVTRDTIASWETGRNEIPKWLLNMIFLMQNESRFKEQHLEDNTIQAVVVALQEALRYTEQLGDGLVALGNQVGMPEESKLDINTYNSPANILYQKELEIRRILKDILKNVWWKVDITFENN